MSTTTLKVKLYKAEDIPPQDDDQEKPSPECHCDQDQDNKEEERERDNKEQDSKDDQESRKKDQNNQKEEEGKGQNQEKDSTPSIPNTDKEENTTTSANTGFFHTETPSSSSVSSPILPIIAFSLFVFALLFTIFLPKFQRKLSKSSSRYNLKSEKTNKLRLFSLVFASFSLLFGLVSTVLATRPIYNVESSEILLLDADILGTDDIALAHDTITIDNASDLKLYITSNSPNLTDFFTTENGEPNTISTLAEKGPLLDNSYGVYIGTEQPNSSSDFYPIYLSQTVNEEQYILSLADLPETEGETRTLDVWYGVRSKSAKNSIYTVDLNIEAFGTEQTPDPEPEPEPIDLSTMQSMTPEICSALEIDEEYVLTDARDNKEYRIAKLQDGNCWMLDNLDLTLVAPSGDNSTGGTKRLNPETNEEEIVTLDSSNTNLPENTIYTPTTTTSTGPNAVWDYGDLDEGACIIEDAQCSDKQFSFDPEPESSESGIMYNYLSASAGTVKIVPSETESEDEDDINIETTPITASICPKGWTLAGAESYLQLFARYGIGIITINEISNETISAFENTIPNFTNLSSGFYDPLFGIAGDTGYISTAQNEYEAPNTWVLFQSFPSSIVNLKQFNRPGRSKDGGFAIMPLASNIGKLDALLGGAVRCVAEFPSSTISFAPNTEDDVENLPENISVNFSTDTLSRSTTITLPEKIPTRNGYIFAGWSLKPERDDTVYYPGSQRTLNSPNTIFYATWLKATPVSTLQEFNTDPDACSSLTIDEVYGLRDSRDGKVYSVSRLRDGKCWMTQNLALEPETTLTPLDSNVAENYTLPESTEDKSHWNEYENTLKRMYKEDFLTYSGIPISGYYYNYITAIAKEDSSSLPSTQTNATTSICPVGWRLPTSGEDYNNNDFYTLANYYGTPDEEDNDNFNVENILTTPLFFSLSGYHTGEGTIRKRTKIGKYWSSTIDYSYTYSSSIDGEKLTIDTKNANSINDGISVRCLFSPASPSSPSNTQSVSPTSISSESPVSPSMNGSNYYYNQPSLDLSDNSESDENNKDKNDTSSTSDKSEPLGVIKSTNEATSDSTTIIVIAISALLVITGSALIVVMRKRDREE